MGGLGCLLPVVVNFDRAAVFFQAELLMKGTLQRALFLNHGAKSKATEASKVAVSCSAAEPEILTLLLALNPLLAQRPPTCLNRPNP